MSKFTHKAIFSFICDEGVESRQVFWGKSPLSACRQAARAVRKSMEFKCGIGFPIGNSKTYGVTLETVSGSTVGFVEVYPIAISTCGDFDGFNKLFDEITLFTGVRCLNFSSESDGPQF